MRRTDDVSLWTWPLTLKVTTIVGHTRFLLYKSTKFKFRSMARHTMWPCWLWPLTLEVMPLASDTGLRSPCAYQLWSSWALPFRRYSTFCVSALVTQTFDLLTLKLVRNVALVMGYHLATYGDTTTIRIRFMAIGPTRLRLITWPCDLATLTFYLGGHDACGWWELSFTIRIPIRIPYHSEDVSALMGLVTLTFNLLTFKLVCESHLRCWTFLPHLVTLGLWVLGLFAKLFCMTYFNLLCTYVIFLLRLG